MKSTLKLATLALAVMFASCGDSNESSTTTTTTGNAESTPTMAAETPNAPATDSGAGMNATANTGMSDQDFVTKASSMNVAEVAAHKAAQSRATNAEVKKHAKHMLTDHQQMGEEMKALASKKNMTVSNEPPAEKKQAMDDMNANKKGKDWDMAYVDQQIRDHQEAISLFEQGSGSVKDADLKALIDKTLPKLRDHLQMVQDAQSKLNQ